MPNKAPHKDSAKKPSRSIKEKRQAKKAKQASKH